MVSRFQKIDIWKSVVVGVFINIITLFGIYPAFHVPAPEVLQALGIVALDQAVGFVVIGVSKLNFSRIADRIEF